MRFLAAVALPILAITVCEPSDGYSTELTTAWQTQTSQQVGDCEFMLDQAFLRHDVEWQAGAEITMTNVGSENTRCEWQISIIGSAGDVISSRAGHAENLAAEDSISRYVDVSGNFAADALQHGAWLHVRAHQGLVGGPEEQFDVADPGREARF